MVESQWGPIEGGSDYFEETVSKNLRLGRFLTLIVGDRIRQSVVDMLSYVNRFPHLAMDVALVELRCYQWHPSRDWPLLVVPRIAAQTEIVERSVVQVTLEPPAEHEVTVRQERAAAGAKGRARRVTLTEEAFWEQATDRAPDGATAARELISRYRERDGIEIVPGSGSLIVKLTLPESGEQVSLFFLRRDLQVNVWPNTIARQLVRAGLSEVPAAWYRRQVSSPLAMPAHRREFATPLENVEMARFTDVVDEFIQRILASEAQR